MSKINISELKRIVKLANDLDGKGLHKEADLLDSVIAGFKKMANDSYTQTYELLGTNVRIEHDRGVLKLKNADTGAVIRDLKFIDAIEKLLQANSSGPLGAKLDTVVRLESDGSNGTDNDRKLFNDWLAAAKTSANPKFKSVVDGTTGYSIMIGSDGYLYIADHKDDGAGAAIVDYSRYRLATKDWIEKNKSKVIELLVAKSGEQNLDTAIKDPIIKYLDEVENNGIIPYPDGASPSTGTRRGTGSGGTSTSSTITAGRKAAVDAGTEGPASYMKGSYAGMAWFTGGRLYEILGDNSIFVFSSPWSGSNGNPTNLKSDQSDYVNRAVNQGSEFIKAIKSGYSLNNASVTSQIDALVKKVYGLDDAGLQSFKTALGVGARPPAAGSPPPTDSGEAGGPPAAGAEPPPAAGSTPPTNPAGTTPNVSAALSEYGLEEVAFAGGKAYMMPSYRGAKKGRRIGIWVSMNRTTGQPAIGRRQDIKYVIQKTSTSPLKLLNEGDNFALFGISEGEKSQLDGFKRYVIGLLTPVAAAPKKDEGTAPPETPAPPETDGPRTTTPTDTTPPGSTGTPTSSALDSLTKKYSYFSKGIIRR